MTPLHEQKVRQMQELMQLSPEEFLTRAPADVRYIFARLEKFFVLDDKGALAFGNTEFLKGNNSRLFFELNTRANLPPQYRVIAELPLESGMRMNDDRCLGRAALIEVLPAH